MEIQKTGQIVALNRTTSSVALTLANGARCRIPFPILAGSHIWLKVGQTIEITGHEDQTRAIVAHSINLIADLPQKPHYNRYSATATSTRFVDTLFEILDWIIRQFKA